MAISIDKCWRALSKYAKANGVILDPDRSVEDGTTEDRKSGMRIIVGSKERYNEATNDLAHFVTAVVSVHHEMAHRRHLTEFPDRDEPAPRAVLLNYYACQASRAYYYGHNLRNYRRQPYEIAAQCEGIIGGYRFLAKLLDDKQAANDAICAYVNDRIKRKVEFIRSDKPFADIRDIVHAFSDKFEAVKDRRKYIIFDNFKENPDCPGVVVRDALTEMMDRTFNKDLLRIRLHDRKSDQDLCLAQVFLAVDHEGNTIKKQPWCRSIRFPQFLSEKPKTADPRYGSQASIYDILRNAVPDDDEDAISGILSPADD